MNIGLTYDLRSEYLAAGFSPEQVAEFDADETVNALDATLTSLGARTVRIGTARSLCRRLADGERWDLVFNIAEGMHGRSREAQVPALLEAFDIPYSGSDPLVCALTLDKTMTKRLVAAAGLRTPRYALVSDTAEAAGIALPFPLFAKPNAEGTGKGIDQTSRIEDRSQLAATCAALLARFHQPVLVEEYLPGREFTVAILGTGGRARALGTMEIEVLPHAGSDIYSYHTKEKCDDLVRYSALAAGPLRQAVEELAVQSFRILECRDVGRVDVRLDAQGRPSFMEINPLPGMQPSHSDLPMIAAQQKVSYRELVRAIVESALERIPEARRPKLAR
ncbi:MAG: D-alanine--D-alanine ligase [Lentisphaerae bacterium ADurb.BinA184]|nr:MAG: D-alanine--D-alanine ligase [Lentisphaerae bacterium ADurb.BinA184]